MGFHRHSAGIQPTWCNSHSQKCFSLTNNLTRQPLLLLFRAVSGNRWAEKLLLNSKCSCLSTKKPWHLIIISCETTVWQSQNTHLWIEGNRVFLASLWMAFETAKNKGHTQISLCQWHSCQFQWLHRSSQAGVLSTGLAPPLECPDRRCHWSTLQCRSGQHTCASFPEKPARKGTKRHWRVRSHSLGKASDSMNDWKLYRIFID